MAFSKASMATLMMAVVLAALALAGSAQDLSPAPAPASGAGSISPSFAAAGVALLSALVFGSVLRV